MTAETPAAATRWENDIRAFEAADQQSPPPLPRGGIVFIGASGIRKWETLERDFAPLPVVRRGFGGTAVLERIVFPHAPRVVVLQSGNNDIHAGRTPDQVCTDVAAFIAQVRSGLPWARVAVVSITTSPSRFHEVETVKRANAQIRRLLEADSAAQRYIDIFPAMLDKQQAAPRAELFADDNLHMNAEGYRVRTARIRPVVEALYQESKTDAQ